MIVYILLLHEGGKYSELGQLFIFDMLTWFMSINFGFSPTCNCFQGRGNMSWLPCVIESLSEGGGSSICVALEIKSALILVDQ